MEGQRIFTSFINIFVYFIPKQWFSRFLKTFIRLLPKLSAICTLRLCRSLCLRHLREIVFILSPPCSPTLCVTLICSKLTLSLQIPEEPKKTHKFYTTLKSVTKPLNVLIAFTRPLITEFADNLNLKHPLLPTISPYPTM